MTITVDLVHHCSICGVKVDCDWLEITAFGDAMPSYAPGKYVCPTPRCGEVCRTCRREPGDVHGPHCWVHMRDKVERPHIVTLEDCR